MSLAPFDPFTPAFVADPYAHYARYRAQGPIHRGVAPNPKLSGAWYLLGHAEVMAALQDERLGRDAGKVLAPELRPALPPGYAPFAAMFRRWLVFLDPPDHTRLRRLVSRSFTPDVVTRLRPRIRAAAERLVDALVDEADFDLVGAFALPLPLRVIAELIGVEAEHSERFAAWSHAMSQGNNLRRPAPAQVYADAGAAATAMAEYITEAADARRRAPRDDLLSRLVAAEDEDGALTPDELVATCVHLLTAGHETVVHAIAKGTLALLRTPEAAARLRDRSVPAERVVDELLRFDPPVQIVSRWALADMTLAGIPIARGDAVMLAIGAANRDPDAFEPPDQLAFDRPPNRHATFGLGIHYCLGAALARLETAIALELLFTRLPGLACQPGPLRYRDSVVFHGLERLDLRTSDP